MVQGWRNSQFGVTRKGRTKGQTGRQTGREREREKDRERWRQRQEERFGGVGDGGWHVFKTKEKK